jgi:hypothetical protein
MLYFLKATPNKKKEKEPERERVVENEVAVQSKIFQSTFSFWVLRHCTKKK